MAHTTPTEPRRLALHGWLGLGLVALSWTLDWGLSGLRTHVLFFPLWSGTILTLDALVLLRSGTSLLTRSPARLALLFVLSVPLWWLFEAINERTANWEYLGREHFSPLAHTFWSSLCFSTVAPAVFEASELVLTWRGMDRFARGPALRPTRSLLGGMFCAGLVMAGAMLVWPRACYPFVWTSLVLLLEPLCVVLGRRSLLSSIAHGDWRRFFALWFGTLGCGVLWELWNVHSYPKWIYHTPGVEFLYLFEMPLLGYLGYFAFGLEVYVFCHLLWPGAPPLRIPGDDSHERGPAGGDGSETDPPA